MTTIITHRAAVAEVVGDSFMELPAARNLSKINNKIFEKNLIGKIIE
jgi:hypothetical protein